VDVVFIEHNRILAVLMCSFCAYIK